MKEEYDEEFLNYLKENDPSMYDEFTNGSRKDEGIEEHFIEFSRSNSYDHGGKTVSNYQKLEFSLSSDDKEDDRSFKLKLIWFGVIAGCIFLSFISFILLFIFRGGAPIFCGLTCLFPSLLLIAYPIFAIMQGAIRSFSIDPNTKIMSLGDKLSREKNPKTFWFTVVLWMVFGLFMIVLPFILLLLRF